MQTKIVIPDDIYEKIKIRAKSNYRTINQEINYILDQVFNHTQLDITPSPFIYSPTITTPSPVSPIITSTYTPDPSASTIDISPTQPPETIPDYSATQLKSEQKSKPVISGPDVSPTPTNERLMPEGLTGSRVDPIPTSKFAPKKLKSTLPVSTDLEIEQVDNEWDAECNEYSTEDFLFDLKNLEEKMREDSPFTDPTKDPDYVTLKNYFIKHDLRERFRSLLSDPSRFYPEEGVYEQPQIRYAQAAFRKEKIDEEYIIALLSGTGDTYRATHHMKLYVDEM